MPSRILAALLALALSGPLHAATQTRTSAFEYDPVSGLLTKEIIEPDTPQLRLETAYSYDAYGNKIAATVSSPATGLAAIAARTSSNTYDAQGRFATGSSNALNQTETKTFDPRFGAVTSLTGPNGLTTQWQYDGFGRKVLEIRADGTQTKTDYLFCSGIGGGTAPCPALAVYLIQTTPLAADGLTQNGAWSKTYHDALNREIRAETQGYDGAGSSPSIYKDTQYDNLGRVYRVSRPYYSNQTPYWTSYSYDALGRLITETKADGSQTTFAYNGLSTSVTNANNQTETKVKNSQGQLIRTTDALNHSLTYQYDPFGNLTQTIDPAGNTTTLSYDLRGRKTQMNDPDMGIWTYDYNALGELVRQTDAKAQITTIAYDQLGRMTQRSEPDLVSTWSYDTCAKGIGKLCQAAADNGYLRSQSYDNLGRPVSTTTTIDTAYAVASTYDANGRIATQTYPTGFSVQYLYTALGYLKEVRNNDASNTLYWRADTKDAEGHLQQQTYGNGIVTQQTYQAATGRPTALYAGAGNLVLNLTYQYDSLGNLTTRTDANQNLVETFLYDALNRLTSSGGASIGTKTYSYDAIGNLTSRSDVGSYTYGAVNNKPHAVIGIAGTVNTSFTYDANGNLIAGAGRNEFYTSYNMPLSIGNASLSLGFAYGPEHQRVRQVAPNATTIYLHPDNQGSLFYEKDLKADGSIEHKHYINAGGQAIAVYTQKPGGNTTRYLHRDHLGSIATVTDEAGTVVERFSYEPFGKRRFPNGASDPNNTIQGQTTDRGYTGHEHLDELGLIHMNGRIYDPLIGRFMSADPQIQAPGNLQSYNRYSYVMNNPLIFTDPSGYSWWTKFRDKVLKPVAAIAIAVYAPEFLGQYMSGMAANMTAGFASGMVSSGGDVRAGVISALTAGAFGGMHDWNPTGFW